MPGTGKTWLMGRYVQGCNRVIVFNTVSSFGSGLRQNRLPGFVHLSNLKTLAKYLAKCRAGRFRICYTPSSNVTLECWHVTNLTWEVRDCVYALEEPWHLGNPLDQNHPVRRMLLTGRHHGINLMWTAQFPASVDATFRKVSNTLYLGRLTTALDRKSFAEMLPPKALDLLPKLPNRHFIQRDELMNWKLVKS